MNAPWSFQGNLWPLQSIGTSASYYQAANKPSLFGVNNVYGKAMTVYEGEDDFGSSDTYASQYNGSACREIACCNIRRYHIIWEAATDYQYIDKDDGRNLNAMDEDIDYFTPEEFRNLFGYDPDPEDILNADQN